MKPESTYQDKSPHLPPWAVSKKAETPEDAAFLSGAALSHLHVSLARDAHVGNVLTQRLALSAAEACVTFSGRPERANDLRDTFHLLRAGDLPGPAGETYLCWRRAVQRPLSIKALKQALPHVDAELIERLFVSSCPNTPAGGINGPGLAVAHASHVLGSVLDQKPRAESAALILADAALAHALGWGHLVPLFAMGIKRQDLRQRGDALRFLCHRAAHAAAIDAVRLSAELVRKVARLDAVAPKLRAKTAAQAVEMFRTRDAVSPSALPLPDRSARRLCDRLVDLGAVRELTGRDTFRLYGV